MNHENVLWIVFNVLVVGVLYVDLFLANKNHYDVSLKKAAVWYGVWVLLALLFAGGIFLYLSPEMGIQFLTGYVIEQSLSVDNMFVFILIFSYFKIEAQFQPKILKWGILGAVAMRFVFIFAGAALMERFHWMIYVFGAFLVYTAYGMVFGTEKEFDPQTHPVFKHIMRVVPLGGFDGERFFSRAKTGALIATPLFLTLLVIEFSDVIFALDSIPAVFAITTDRFIVYTSNVFAILGLRSLYFLLAGLVGLFAYLKIGVAVVLAFVGIKMLVSHYVQIPTLISLGAIVVILAGSIGFSIKFPPKNKAI